MRRELAARTSHLVPEGAYAVLGRARELERQGKRILHLELGEPDFPTPAHIARAGSEAIHAGRTHYTPPAGLPELRGAIAEAASEQRGVSITPEMVVVGPGTKPGMLLAALALLEPGDEVVYPDPGFPTYTAIIPLTGAVGVPLPLSEEAGFSFERDAFDRCFSEKTRLVILNSPSNPTGALLSAEDLSYVAARVRAHDAWVLSDEIYSRLVFGPDAAAPSILSQPEMLERSVVVDGFSKVFAMTGWRLGYAIAPPALARRLELLITHSTGSAAEFTQVAALEALRAAVAERKDMLAELRRRRDRLVELLNAIPGVHCLRPGGAFYLFPNVRAFGLPAAEIQRRLLEDAGVAVLAGTDFGPGGEGHLRLSYASSLAVLEEALDRIRSFLIAL